MIWYRHTQVMLFSIVCLGVIGSSQISLVLSINVIQSQFYLQCVSVYCCCLHNPVRNVIHEVSVQFIKPATDRVSFNRLHAAFWWCHFTGGQTNKVKQTDNFSYQVDNKRQLIITTISAVSLLQHAARHLAIAITTHTWNTKLAKIFLTLKWPWTEMDLSHFLRNWNEICFALFR